MWDTYQMQSADTTTRIVSAGPGLSGLLLRIWKASRLVSIQKASLSFLNCARNPGLGWPGGQRGQQAAETLACTRRCREQRAARVHAHMHGSDTRTPQAQPPRMVQRIRVLGSEATRAGPQIQTCVNYSALLIIWHLNGLAIFKVNDDIMCTDLDFPS